MVRATGKLNLLDPTGNNTFAFNRHRCGC
jgi:hypothetical protein